jgi:hypothetical protein
VIHTGDIMLYTDLNYDTTGRRRKKKKAKGVVCKKFKSPEFRVAEKNTIYRRASIFDVAPSNENTRGSTAKVESKKYTGSLVIGIATMHKSNAVPIINDEQAKDISRMRRG